MRKQLFSLLILFSITTQAQIPTLLKDINPSGNSKSRFFRELKGKTFFIADNGVNGDELWVTDGTNLGTKMVKDINPGSAGSGALNGAYRGFGVLNDKLFFAVQSNASTRSMWVTDGTQAGTVKLKDINTQSMMPTYHFVEMNNKLFFGADDGINGGELWVTDGTANGTVLVKDIHPGISSSYPDGLTVF